MKKEDFHILLGKYIHGNASVTESRLLEEYYTRLSAGSNRMGTGLTIDDEERLRLQMLEAILVKAGMATRTAAPVIKIKQNPWWKYAAAAAVTIAVATSAYFYFNKKPVMEPVQTQASLFTNDVAPGGNKAILTLGNGKQIILDSARKGTVAQQGNAKIVKTDNGKLAYNINVQPKAEEIVYNTLTTPRGGQYQLTLPDGSQVWLNAASTITYPTAFTGKQRDVQITGEAYFEVTKNPDMPFHVQVSGTDIAVLGTHFNVNGYTNEKEIRTTLLEGSIKITRENNSNLLKPGQQARTNLFKNDILIVDNADMERTVGWKNGKFIFDRDELPVILRELERWYDVDVEYRSVAPAGHFSGIISRNKNASQVLHMLQATGNIHFDIEGKKIIVLP